ncbi:MAG TPA: HAMP domain-containing sensor histidine kinase [Holophagaceae bacterium]
MPAFMGRALLSLGAVLFLGVGLGMSVRHGVSLPWTLGLITSLVLVVVLLARWQVRLVAEPLGQLLREAKPMAIEDLPSAWSALEQENLDLKERAAREDQLLRSIMTRLEEGVLLFGSEGRLEIYNPAAQRLLGLGAPLSQGQLASVVFSDRESPVAIQRAYLGVPSEWRLARAARTLRVRAIPFAPSGFTAGVLLTLDDVTRQEALETTRQKFISNVSHELKTPVTAIRIAAENLQEERLSESGQASAQALLRSVDRLALLLGDLSELSRIESGALHLEPVRLDLDAFLDALSADYGSRHAASGIRLDLQKAYPPGAAVLVDPLRLSQILENLVSNAVKFSPADGTVRVQASLTDRHMQWEVSDQGPGIPDSEQGRIFERFYRAKDAKAKPGTGLGLAIVKHLCRLMGGEVSVESQPGAGARFRVVLPLQQDQAPAGPPSR